MNTALYRRYRPDTFADVIGQEHVTEPLVAAIDSGRINHAYLFSGPRGCGKTTSARIFARCLNCAQGPTGSPCGECDSCVDLARGGPGSLDVVELDAASHGGVDDARDLRERAIFAPARDRYKIFIIDEAHMVTTQGFNALLKLVEEPPEHVKFVFATTEPEKVIGTIRSRTHHYPFRLVPPERLSAYLTELAQAEDIRIEDGVIPLVVRAGAGSVRDSLSVLDQLMAGAIDGVVGYERAVALLGYTPEGLLDDAVAALAAHDGAGLFGVVEQVISSGHSPRRFAEDLLERFRDLIVVLAAGESAKAVLPQVAADQLERMRTQAQHLGAATCSRAADLVHDALDQMVGATSPRLQLELLCARLLLPAAEEGVRALAVRLDRIESGATPAPTAPAGGPSPSTGPAPATGAPSVVVPGPQSAPVKTESRDPRAPASPAPASSAPVSSGPAPAPREREEPEKAPAPAAAAWQAAAQAHREKTGDDGWPSVQVPGSAPTAPATEPPAPEPPAPEPPAQGQAAAPAGASHEPRQQPPQQERPQQERPQQEAPQSRRTPPAGPAAPQRQEAPADSGERPGETGGSDLTVQQLRNRWPEVLQTLARLKRSSWVLVAQDAQVVDLQPGVLTIGFSTAGLASAFQGGAHAEPLSRALADTLGMNLRIETTIVGAGGRSGPPSTPRPAPNPGPGRPPQSGPSEPPRTQPGPTSQPPQPRAESGPPAQARPEGERPGQATGGASAGAEPAGPAEPPAPAGPSAPATPHRPAGAPSPSGHPSPPWEADIPAAEPPDDYDEYSPDDADIGGSDLVGPPLVAKMLGGTVIDEIVDD
ncbi:MAG TPA: DNA polymerase III subunit gamma and tau [Beutenbergiaceae bacterium]|nr:DNA polymerase III subunit gamma and tau [Beutenbergiaceae bacterium]